MATTRRATNRDYMTARDPQMDDPYYIDRHIRGNAIVKHYREITSSDEEEYFEQAVRSGRLVHDNKHKRYLDTNQLNIEIIRRLQDRNRQYSDWFSSVAGDPRPQRYAGLDTLHTEKEYSHTCEHCGSLDCHGIALLQSENDRPERGYRCEGERRIAEKEHREKVDLQAKQKLILDKEKEQAALEKEAKERKQQSELYWNQYSITGKLPFVASCRK